MTKGLYMLLTLIFMVLLVSCVTSEPVVEDTTGSSTVNSVDESITTATFSPTEEAELPTIQDSFDYVQHYEDVNSKSMILPEDVEAVEAVTDDWFLSFTEYGFTVEDVVGDKAYGKLADLEEYKYYPVVYDMVNGNFITISEPEEISDLDWVGTNAKIVMMDRYLYDWRCYTMDSEATVLLRRTDLEECVVEIIDIQIQETPFTYLLRLDETSFLSYSSSTQEDDSVLSEVYIYDLDGNKSLLISESYVSHPGADDEGVLLEHLLLSGDKLCGIGRRNVAGDTKYYAYYYNLDGEFIEMSEIKGLDNLLGYSSIYDVGMAGNYLVFRSYDSMTSYVCEITDEGVKVIAKGLGVSVSYGVTNEYIFFTESYTELSSSVMRLYILEVATGEIVAVDFSMPFEKTFITTLKSTSDGGVIIRLNEGESVSTLDQYVYYLTKEIFESKYIENN